MNVGDKVTLNADRYDAHNRGTAGTVVEVVEPVAQHEVDEWWKPGDPRLDLEPGPLYDHWTLPAGRDQDGVPITQDREVKGEMVPRVHVHVVHTQNPAYPLGCVAVDLGGPEPAWFAWQDLEVTP